MHIRDKYNKQNASNTITHFRIPAQLALHICTRTAQKRGREQKIQSMIPKRHGRSKIVRAKNVRATLEWQERGQIDTHKKWVKQQGKRRTGANG